MLLTAAVFTFVLLLGNALREILPLLIEGQATFGMVVQAFALLIPFVWVFALPMGMLTATLLVFGRFSADQELTAARASGVSLVSLVTPILILSLLLCGISALVNLEIAPRCRVAYNSLRYDLKAVLANVQLPAGRPIKEFQGYIIYIGKNRKQNLEDVLIYVLEGDTVQTKLNAPRGSIEIDTPNQRMVLRLYDVKIIDFANNLVGSAGEWPIALDLKQKSPEKTGIRDMTFSELQRELRDLESRINLPPAMPQTPPQERLARVRELDRHAKDITERIRVQIHRQMAFSFACFGFTLVGIPLGIRVHRRETNVGVAIALILVLIYYGLIVAGESLSARPEFAPHLLVWLPNFIFQAIGVVLLWRANRGL